MTGWLVGLAIVVVGNLVPWLLLRPRKPKSVRLQPTPPENIVAVMRDGSRVPLEFAYVGKRNGMCHWVAVWALPEQPERIVGGMLPAQTSLEVRSKRTVPSGGES